MGHNFAIVYDDEDQRIDDVILAVVPIDAFTGLIVRNKVTASITGMPDRPIRNLSGHLVFIDRPDSQNFPQGQEFEFSVGARRAGYFDPPKRTFNAPDRDDPDASLRRQVVPLMRLPSFAFPAETTLALGVLKDNGKPVDGAHIEAELLDGFLPGAPVPDRFFATRTDVRGAFALAFRLPPGSADAENGVLVRFKFRGAEDRFREVDGEQVLIWDVTLRRRVKDGRSHSFMAPIDLNTMNTDTRNNTETDGPLFIVQGENIN